VPCKSRIIFLVKDEAINRVYLRKLLAKYGYAVTYAVNGQDALDVLSKEVFA